MPEQKINSIVGLVQFVASIVFLVPEPFRDSQSAVNCREFFSLGPGEADIEELVLIADLDIEGARTNHGANLRVEEPVGRPEP